MMIAPIPRFFSRRLQLVPVSLCLIAVAMQVSLPVLHSPHFAAIESFAVAAGGAPVLEQAGGHEAGPASHDTATCQQCRLVSQLKTLAPLSALATAPVICADWIPSSSLPDDCSQAERESGAPRAPPSLA